MKKMFYLLVCVFCVFSCKKSCDTSVFGDFTITNQSDIDNLSCFLDGGSKFDSKLTLSLKEGDEYDWLGLENLIELKTVKIKSDGAMQFLDQIEIINEDLIIGPDVTFAYSHSLRMVGNTANLSGDSLKTVDFPQLEEVGWMLYFSHNPTIEEIRGFNNLINVGEIFIDNCKNLRLLPKFEKLERIEGKMHLRLSDDIVPANAFSNLRYCGQDISFNMYCDVTDFSYFKNLEYCPQFVIIANYVESDLCGLSDYASIEGNRIQVSTYPAFGGAFYNEQIIEACD